MAKKKNWKEIEMRIGELADRVKNSTITPEERIELFQQREALRRHEATEELKALKEGLAKAKREALLRIIEANGITTENELKDIFRFVRETKPELLPSPAPEEPEKTDGDAAPSSGDEQTGDGDGATEQAAAAGEKNEGTESDAGAQTGEAPVCERCGAAAEKRHSKKKDKDYWICPAYNDADRGHLFQWID